MGTSFSRVTVVAKVCLAISKRLDILRHTFASAVTLKNGVPVETVQQMMGHKKISTTMRYAKVDEEKIQRDMDKVEQKLGKPATTTDRQTSSRTL
jgi:site-specific recombinase XerD